MGGKLSWALALVATTSLLGCSSDDVTTDDGGGSDASDAAKEPEAEAAAAPVCIPYEGGVDAAYFGTVGAFVSETPVGTGFEIDEIFVPAGDGGTTSCSGTAVGDCCFTPSPPADAGADADADADAATAQVSAGDISIYDGPALIDHAIWAFGTSYANVGAGSWAPSDVLSVFADGGTVDPFCGSVRATGALGLADGGNIPLEIAIDRATNYSFAWRADPGAPGARVTLLIGNQAGSLSCTTDDSAGTITAPSQLLMMLDSGSGAWQLLRQVSVNVPDPNADVHLVSAVAITGVGVVLQ